MEWNKFNTHGASPNHAFEVMCNILFEKWCRREYGETLKFFTFVNGEGGDGGVEAYGVLASGEVVGVQSKWFPEHFDSSQASQVEKSFRTAVEVRPDLKRYIVCIPKDFTSDKKTKNGKISKVTEDSRWKSLVEKLHSVNDNVEVILWNETRIFAEFQYKESVGSYNFWFGKNVIEDEIRVSFDKAKAGWANTKYIPDLYTTGSIHRELDSFLDTPAKTQERLNSLDSVIGKLGMLERAYNDLLRLEFPEDEAETVNAINDDIKTVAEWRIFFNRARDIVKNGDAIRVDNFFPNTFNLKCLRIDLKDSRIHFHNYSHFADVEKYLETIAEDVYECQENIEGTNDNRIIFLGNQGTGKTAGIIGEIEKYLQEGIFTPILVHASDFRNGESWLSIINKTLGISYGLSELEMLELLDNSAYIRGEVCNKSSKHDGVIHKCVICVDGIDESASWNFWKTKIREAKVFADIFPRIKFVFLSRPYVFGNIYNEEFYNTVHYISSNGDVSVQELFDKYTRHYNVTVGKNLWIKNALRTPMALKLFCDLYTNSSIDKIDHNSLVITRLFDNKINSMEEEFLKRSNIGSSGRMVRNVLSTLASLMSKSNNIAFQDIYNACKEPERGKLEYLLEFLKQEGFIFSHYLSNDEIFGESETVYSWGMQPAYDFLMAKKIAATIDADVDFPEYSEGIYQMLSVILLEEKNRLIFDYKKLKFEHINKFDLLCYGLVNSSQKAVEAYHDNLIKYMGKSIDCFHEVVNKVIIPLCRVANHPLGVGALDEFLSAFSTAAERDVWWSIPIYYREGYDAPWACHTAINIDDIVIYDDEPFNSTSMLVAWRLSNVSNEIRHQSRVQLTKWGIACPDEFYKLFVHFAYNNDPQIREDIFGVLYAVSLSKHISESFLANVSQWMVEHVFSDEGLQHFEDAAVRYYARGIVEIAIGRGVKESGVEKTVKPPYKNVSKLLPICNEAVDSKRMSGFGPIKYDLARYVLCDHLSDAFFKTNYRTQSMSAEAQNVFNEYAVKITDIDVKPDGLIIAMAYQYLLNHGWSRDVFWEYEDKEKIGVDIAIRGTYYPATHGSVSSVMSVSEKYTWCAKNAILAFLADRIPLSDYSGETEMLNDYGNFQSFSNAFQEYIESQKKCVEQSWYNVESMAYADSDTMTIDNIEKWMKDESVPDFVSWIEKDGYTLLETFTNINNDVTGIEETVWISSGLVVQKDMKKLLSLIAEDNEDCNSLLAVSDFSAYQESYCFCTPQEACAVISRKEVNSSFYLNEGEDCIELKATTSSCLTENAEETEKRYELPSAFLRKILGIVYGDGYNYIDKDDNVLAVYSAIGENWKSQQNTLRADSTKFKSALKKIGYTPFWLYRVYRSPSSKAYELYKNQILHDTDRTFIIWFEKDELKYQLLHEVKPIEMQKFQSSEQDSPNLSIFNDLLKQYGSDDT